MSTTETRLRYSEAYRAAPAFGRLFGGTFERWRFAGSLRRKCPTIGDVEHVVIPKWVPDPEKLFDQAEVNAVRRTVEALAADCTVSLHRDANGRTRCGDKLISVEYEGQVHEIFMCNADNWGCIYAIRTGPVEFSKMLVTRLPKFGYRQLDGYLEKSIRHAGQPVRYERVPCPDEATYLKAAGFDHVIPPENRR